MINEKGFYPSHYTPTCIHTRGLNKSLTRGNHPDIACTVPKTTSTCQRRSGSGR